MNWLYPLAGLALLAAGAAGQWFGVNYFAANAPWLLAAGAVFLGVIALRWTYDPPGKAWSGGPAVPKPISLGAADYLKALVCWLDGYYNNYAVEPGLYFTGGSYDRTAPLLVTANYHLSVFLLVRRIGARRTRVLVIDTDGINVWCSAGKGRFSNAEIFRQLERYDRELLTAGDKIELVLPKFGLSGVNLAELRRVGIRPIIGPLYAEDVPAYLDAPPYRDRDQDRVHYNLKSRAFTWLPGMLQWLGYTVLIAFGLSLMHHGRIPWPMFAVITLIATAYPLLFPYLPGRRFAVKGISLAVLISVGLLAWTHLGGPAPILLLPSVLLVFAAAIFFGLSYTGNSAVSNYSRVRLEIARFLPVTAVLLVAGLAASFL